MDYLESIIYDVLALLLIVLISPGLRLKRKMSSYSKNLIAMSLSIIAVYLTDLASVMLQNRTFSGAIEISYAVDTLYFILQAVYAYTWMTFAKKINGSESTAGRWICNICKVLLVFECVLVISNLFTHWFFSISPLNTYVREDYYEYMLVPFVMCFLAGIVFVFDWLILAKDVEAKNSALQFMTFFSMPVIGGALQVIYPGSPWLWSLATVSLFLLEISIEHQSASETKINRAIKMLGMVFYKIAEINLTEESLRIIKNDLPESESTYRNRKDYSESIRLITDSDSVFEDDREDYCRIMNVMHLRSYFDGGGTFLIHKHRRKTQNGYRWVSTELIRCNDYSPENRVVMLYVRDIDDEYIEEIKQSKKLEYSINHDLLTGAHSHRFYSIRLNELAASGMPVGVVYADINNLKSVNDTEGHEAGDRYIKYFANRMAEIFGNEFCYRISGDEFAVLDESGDKSQFDSKVDKLEQSLETDKMAVASFGSVWCENSENIFIALRDAEDKMYQYKDRFYIQHSELTRRTGGLAKQ